MNKNKTPFKTIVISIIIGAVIGSLIGVLGVSGIIPKTFFESVTSMIIKLGIGLIILIIDLLFSLALLKPFLDRYIEKNGISTDGIIEDVQEIPYPDQLSADEWVRKVRYACIISYNVGTDLYKKEFPPTFLTSKRELYPFSFETGNKICIKYLKKFPSFALIDVEQIKTGQKKEHHDDLIHLIMLPLIITITYITTLIML